MKKFLLIILVMTILVVGCQSTSQQENPFEFEERTYYESLDLSTPENAVITFTDAFARDDFFTVWLVLSPCSQFRMSQSIRLLKWEDFMLSEFKYEIGKHLREEIFGGEGLFSSPWIDEDPENEELFFMPWIEEEVTENGEHLFVGWYEFDFIMLTAKELNALLIDLSGEVTILHKIKTDSKDIQCSWHEVENSMDVVTQLDGIDAEVTFRVVQAASGRWRIFQVIVPGGNEEIVPWSIPPTDRLSPKGTSTRQNSDPSLTKNLC